MSSKRMMLIAAIGLVTILLGLVTLAANRSGEPSTPARVTSVVAVAAPVRVSPSPAPLPGAETPTLPMPTHAITATLLLLPGPVTRPTPTATGTPVLDPAQITLTVRAKIDGVSRLVMKGNSAYWLHVEHVAPGRIEARDEPTYLNGVEWYPVWKDVPNRQNANCKCQSSTFQGIPALAAQSQTVIVRNTQVREKVTVVQQPDMSNQYTLIVEFADVLHNKADWYEVTLAYLPAAP